MRNGKNLKKKKKSASISCRGHIWVDGNEGTFIGYGRVALLEKIRECGSITQAAKLLKISYRHAWELIDSMNRQAQKPFIETVTGGKGGVYFSPRDAGLLHFLRRLLVDVRGVFIYPARKLGRGRQGAVNIRSDK